MFFFAEVHHASSFMDVVLDFQSNLVNWLILAGLVIWGWNKVIPSVVEKRARSINETIDAAEKSRAEAEEFLAAQKAKVENAEAEAAKEEYLKTAANLVDESNVEALTDESRIAAGADIFAKNCAVCHAADGGGGVGPNLTDAYWIHGNDIKDVFKTVKYGVPAKGMIAWKDQLGAADIQDVASYILSLEGTTPANPKEPQGELMSKEAPAAAEATDSTTSAADSTITVVEVSEEE